MELGLRFFKEKKDISHRNIGFFKITDKNGEVDYCHAKKEEKLNCCMIHPENEYKGRWDLWITIVLLFTCIVTPARMAFQVKDDPDAEVK